ncbi:MAG: HigA family addiction module antitoxin [Actinomycetota bacterium]|jgi:HTH-type transcriptional regulator/antitoxin HigA|nr:HigA family addiction module antitoxin [Actinomycetota bacterium]
MTDTMTPAEAFPPGEYLRDELAERGWAQGEFAEIIGRPVQVVSEILNGKKDITPETAIAIGAALGTSAELWMNLQATFRLQQVRSGDTPTIRPVERRAVLRSLVPVRELQRRGWLPTTSDLDELEEAICDLLRIDDVTQTPQLAVAARRTNSDDRFTPEQAAWIARVEQLGAGRVSQSYDPDALSLLAGELVHRIEGPHDLRNLGAWLADCGVALVIELALRNSKMDGIVSRATGTPIIGLSTRGDRMDGFVYTLLHEIAHLTLGHVDADSVTIDEDLDPNGGSERERAANAAAARWIFAVAPAVPPGELTPRILAKIARAHNVHVSFLIGRLQNKGRLEWKDYRRTIPKVRPFVHFG